MIKIIGTAQKDKEVFLYYAYTKGGNNFFKLIASSDGFNFAGHSKYVIATDDKNREEKTYDWKSFHVAKQKDNYFLAYKVNAKSYANLNGATSSDLIRWKKLGKIDTIKESGAVVPDYRNKNRYVMYFGETNIKLAFSSDLKTWKEQETVLIEPRKNFFDDGALEVGGALQVHGHLLMVYYVKKKVAGHDRYYVGACLFDKKDPTKLIWRSDKPLWEHPEKFHNENMSPLGIASLNEELILYWLVGETNVFAVSCPLPGSHPHLKEKVFEVLKRFERNPIITPNPRNPWESRATFNSAAVYEDGKVHFLYRALGDTDLSVLGYATSKDGLTIDERSEMPAYIPRAPFETPGQKAFKSLAEHYVSGGGYGGVEDPRMTKVGDRFYLTYVAFDGATPPRSAMSSISVKDFMDRNWDKWDEPKLISAPGMVNKSAVIFPEKVNGKYVAMHRVYPNILIDYLDDLNFDNYLQGHYFIPPRKNHWDSKKIGAGAPPIKTKDGWLLIYQSVGYQDPSRYKIGAMLLDANNPSKVLYRSNKPLIAPDEHYENAGHKAGVVYPCGAVDLKGELIVYYGGADTVVCAASQNMDTFLDQLKYNQEPRLRKVRAPMLN